MAFKLNLTPKQVPQEKPFDSTGFGVTLNIHCIVPFDVSLLNLAVDNVFEQPKSQIFALLSFEIKMFNDFKSL